MNAQRQAIKTTYHSTYLNNATRPSKLYFFKILFHLFTHKADFTFQLDCDVDLPIHPCMYNAVIPRFFKTLPALQTSKRFAASIVC